MTARKHLDRYLEGWRLGDGELGLEVLAPGFFYDDPNSSRIPRGGFVQFVEDFKADAAALNDGKIGDPFLPYSDIIIDETTTPCTAWCWWRATDTPLQGCALIKFSDDGILSERISYYSPLP